MDLNKIFTKLFYLSKQRFDLQRRTSFSRIWNLNQILGNQESKVRFRKKNRFISKFSVGLKGHISSLSRDDKQPFEWNFIRGKKTQLIILVSVRDGNIFTKKCWKASIWFSWKLFLSLTIKNVPWIETITCQVLFASPKNSEAGKYFYLVAIGVTLVCLQRDSAATIGRSSMENVI